MAGALDKPFRLITTPATIHTREVGFAVKVSVSADWPAKLPVLGDTYSASKASKVRLKEFKSYICTAVEDAGQNYFWLYFSKDKTAAEANTPYKNPHQEFGNHPWPPILIDVDIAKSRLPRSVNAGDAIFRGNSYTATPIWIPSADTGTLFVLREFISPEEPEIPQWPTPTTSSVSFPVPGQGMFNFDGLHHDITVQQMQESDSSYDPASGSTTSHVGFAGERSFKATDPKTWLPYFLYDRPSKIATGAWHRAQMEVIPPPLPPRQRGGR